MTAITHVTWICDGCGEIAASGTLGTVGVLPEDWVTTGEDQFCPACGAEAPVPAEDVTVFDAPDLVLAPGGHA